MGVLRKPVNMRIYVDGVDAVGTVKAIELPEVEFSQMEQSGVGMAGTAEYPTHMSPMEFTLTFLHYPPEFTNSMYDPLRTSQIMLSGEQKAYDGQGVPIPQALNITLRGRPKNIALGSFEEGETAEPEITYSCDYVKLTNNGAVQFEADVLTGIKVGGSLISLFGLLG